MIPFYELSPVMQGTFGTCSILLSVIAVYILVTVCFLQMECRYLLLSIIMMGTLMCISEEIVAVCIHKNTVYENTSIFGLIGSFPWISVFLILLAETVCAGIFLRLIWKRNVNDFAKKSKTLLLHLQSKHRSRKKLISRPILNLANLLRFSV